VRVFYSYNKKSVAFVIKDEGAGFDWRKTIAQECDTEACHGRGLLLIQALATQISFNEKGDEVTLTFDLENSGSNGVTAA
jgi:anti-sigma regulatory factor (Ser/Thr protein kinase)